MKNNFLVGLDAHSVGQEQGGNESYLLGLLEGFSRLNAPEFRFLLFQPDKTEEIPLIKNNPAFTSEKISRQVFWRLFFDLPWQTFRQKLDLLHTQYHLPIVSKCPAVITLHDVSFLRYPGLIPKREFWKMKFSVAYAVKKAKKVITVSEFSKKEILDLYKLKPEKVTVVYNGISQNFRPAPRENKETVLRKYGITKPYIFSVASLHPRKNFVRLIKAFVSLCGAQEGFDYNLVLGGKKLWLYNETIAAASKNPYKNRIILTGYLPEKELVSLYSFADVFVYPSLYEGFGFAPMEAMACGCPVVTSRTSSLPEVTGEAAILVDPYSVDEIAKGILKVLKTPDLRQRAQENSLKQAQKFTWLAAAEKTLGVYEEVLKRKEGE